MSTLKIKRENGKIFCPLADSWHIETPEEKYGCLRCHFSKFEKTFNVMVIK